jgi:hypothetical protein
MNERALTAFAALALVPILASGLPGAEKVEKTEKPVKAGKKGEAAEPPYPLVIPEWHAALGKAVEKKIDFDGPAYETFGQAADALGKAIGVTIELRDRAKEAAGRKVKLLTYKDLPAKDALSLLLKTLGELSLGYLFTPQGIIVTAEAEKYPIPKWVLLSPMVERFQREAFLSAAEKAKRKAEAERASKEGPEWYRKLREKAKKAIVTLDRKEMPFRDALKALSEKSGMKILVDPAIDTSSEKEIETVFLSRPLTEVLDRLLPPRKLAYTFKENSVYITTSDKAKRPEVFVFPEKEYEAAAGKILDRKIEVELRGKRIFEIIPPLEEALGIRIYTCRGAWHSSVRVPQSTAGLTVRQLLAALKGKGIGDHLMPLSFAPEWSGYGGLFDRDTLFLVMKPGGR